MKDSMKEFRKMFPRTIEGYAKMVDGYHYVKYSKLYVYHLKKALNWLKPVPDKMIYPEGEIWPEVEDIIKATADYVNPQLVQRETSTYHGKVLRMDDVKKLVILDIDVVLSDLPQSIIPFEKAREVILKNPDHLCVVNCPCKGAKEDGCYPRDTCIMIGEPIVSFVMDYNQDSPRRITQEEALAIIKAENERGHVQTAYFKDAMGDRLYCICNCCKCCCNAMAAHHYANVPIMAASGYVREITDKCKGCGTCVKFCQFDALSLAEGKAAVDETKCMGCGVCESKCKNEAVAYRHDPAKGEPFDMDEMIQKYSSL